ncbi:mediator-RNA polymerase II transcription subunit 21 [Fusarium austroafricanum]|uniref:Mediator of RNA polymerase II transcription subunit 21 n=1 Tax=Fusarium austroafricanum TaxID=2364996 RepID=A0A8H4K0T1_9HYPO|nr:mediator-RNA polymerase II transcription subunit 21 [Fusarium austroafricanum]
MGDRLTQLQDALATQFVACLHYVNLRHDLEMLGPNDKIREVKDAPKEGMFLFISVSSEVLTILRVDPLPPDEFRAGMVELSQDLVLKEQQIEVLISSLPGLDNSEMDQERYIKELEEDLKIAETQRQEAIKEKDQILSELDSVIRGIRRP